MELKRRAHESTGCNIHIPGTAPVGARADGPVQEKWSESHLAKGKAIPALAMSWFGALASHNGHLYRTYRQRWPPRSPRPPAPMTPDW